LAKSNLQFLIYKYYIFKILRSFLTSFFLANQNSLTMQEGNAQKKQKINEIQSLDILKSENDVMETEETIIEDTDENVVKEGFSIC
jgi:hypothetical protein